MINSKKISDIHLDGMGFNGGYRSCAFNIYSNLLEKFNSKDLLLLESLGSGKVDSKVSLIGINPVFSIEVINLTVEITGNEALINQMQLLYDGKLVLEPSQCKASYELPSRKLIWDFLRVLDRQLIGIDGGVLASAVFAYNTIYFIEDISGYVQGDIPDICLTCYSNFIEFEDERVRLHEYEFIGARSISFAEIEPYLLLKFPDPVAYTHKPFLVNVETQRAEYLQKAQLALNHVQIGDVYQIQIGQKITIKSDISAFDVYARLRLLNPSPYMYLFNCGRFKAIGASPELFVYMKDDELVMRPIAGTLGKSLVPNKKAAEEEFFHNPKEIAEHMMLVDLCRNDLCRVSQPHSLNVSELMSVEEYSHVYHMTSTAQSKVKICLDKYDVIQSSFPAGTMTGAPKIIAIQLISEIEDSGRGLYAGALGVIGLGVNFINTALCIRTTVESNQTFSLRASAGVVADSIIESEYIETLQKMGSVFKAITNEEISCHIM